MASTHPKSAKPAGNGATATSGRRVDGRRVDGVAEALLWTNAIRAEMKHVEKRLREDPPTFHLNVRRLTALTPKIGAVDRCELDAATTTRREADIAVARSALVATVTPPRERYDTPQTDSQRIGWISPDALGISLANSKRATHAACAEVKFAISYFSSHRTMPFCKTQPLVRGGGGMNAGSSAAARQRVPSAKRV